MKSSAGPSAAISAAPGRGDDLFLRHFNQPFAGYSTWSDKTLTTAPPTATARPPARLSPSSLQETGRCWPRWGFPMSASPTPRPTWRRKIRCPHFHQRILTRRPTAASDTWNAWLNKIQVSGGTQDEIGDLLFHAVSRAAGAGDGVRTRTASIWATTARCIPPTMAARNTAFFPAGTFTGANASCWACSRRKKPATWRNRCWWIISKAARFPRWGVITEDSGVMMGDPAAPMIADFYAFGATNFDAQAALGRAWCGRRPIRRCGRRARDQRTRRAGGLFEAGLCAGTPEAAATAMSP